MRSLGSRESQSGSAECTRPDCMWPIDLKEECGDEGRGVERGLEQQSKRIQILIQETASTPAHPRQLSSWGSPGLA